MPKRKSNKSRYVSRFAEHGGFITAAQYLAEMMCQRNALRQGVNLPPAFWKSSKKWGNELKHQLTRANSLIKEYGESAVVLAINDVRFLSCWSLETPSLIPIIKEKRAILLCRSRQSRIDLKPATKDEPPRPPIPRKSILETLRKLDG
jgi:hypothetical protein